MPDELRWLVEFDRAVQDGLGFRVPLDDATRAGLDRLLVIGLRLSSDATETKAELETLLEHHQHGQAGLALVPQGTPTNNTDRSPSGVSRVDDPTRASSTRSRRYRASRRAGLAAQARRAMARRVARRANTSAFLQVPGAEGRDQLEARAMQTALWPATLGYLAGDAAAAVCSRARRSWPCARSSRATSAAAARVPAVRIGTQPYGIMPTRRSPVALRRRGGTSEPDVLDALRARLGVARATGRGLAAERRSHPPLRRALPDAARRARPAGHIGRVPRSATPRALPISYNRANLSGAGERMLQA